MKQIRPNQHINSVQISFLILSNVTTLTTTFEILISDVKGYVLLNREVDISIEGVEYKGVINTGKYELEDTPKKYYLTIQNHSGFGINNSGYFNVNYEVKLQDETITKQDLYNELLVKHPSLTIGGIEMQVPQFGGAETHNTIEFVSDLYTYNTEVFTNMYIELDNKREGEFSIISTDSSCQMRFKIRALGDYISIERIVNINDELNIPLLDFSWVDDNLFLSKCTLLPTIIYTPKTYNIHTSRTTNNPPIYESIKAVRIETEIINYLDSTINNSGFNYGYCIGLDTESRGHSNFTTYGTSVILDQNNIADGNLSEQVILEQFKVLGTSFTFKNLITNTFEYTSYNYENGYSFSTEKLLLDTKFVYIDELNYVSISIFNCDSDIVYIISNTDNGVESKMIFTQQHHEHLADEIITNPLKEFVTKNEKDKWNEMLLSTWLMPVNNNTLLPPTAENGSMCFVESEGQIYKFEGGDWVVLYDKASDTKDGILSKEDFTKFNSFKQAIGLLMKSEIGTNIYTVSDKQNYNKYSGKSNIIDGIITDSGITEDLSISNGVIMMGRKTNDSIQIMDANSDLSHSFGVDNQTINSFSSLNYGNYNKVEDQPYGSVFGNYLKLTQYTKFASGLHNKGEHLYEFGNGKSESEKDNIFSYDALGNHHIKGGIISQNLSSYLDENDQIIIPVGEFTAYNIVGGIIEINNIFDNFVDYEPTTNTINFYKPALVPNPAYDDENPDPNVPEFIQEIASSVTISGGGSSADIQAIWDVINEANDTEVPDWSDTVNSDTNF